MRQWTFSTAPTMWLAAGRVGTRIEPWIATLGKPARRLVGAAAEMNVYRSALAEFALHVADERVVGVMLAEPGRLQQQLADRNYILPQD